MNWTSPLDPASTAFAQPTNMAPTLVYVPPMIGSITATTFTYILFGLAVVLPIVFLAIVCSAVKYKEVKDKLNGIHKRIRVPDVTEPYRYEYGRPRAEQPTNRVRFSSEVIGRRAARSFSEDEDVEAGATDNILPINIQTQERAIDVPDQQIKYTNPSSQQLAVIPQNQNTANTHQKSIDPQPKPPRSNLHKTTNAANISATHSNITSTDNDSKNINTGKSVASNAEGSKSNVGNPKMNSSFSRYSKSSSSSSSSSSDYKFPVANSNGGYVNRGMAEENNNAKPVAGKQVGLTIEEKLALSYFDDIYLDDKRTDENAGPIGMDTAGSTWLPKTISFRKAGEPTVFVTRL